MGGSRVVNRLPENPKTGIKPGQSDFQHRPKDRPIQIGFNMADSKRPEYGVWHAMKTRCQNKEGAKYANYGAKGISVCTRWLDFSSFLEDMGPRPDGYTLDRIDSRGNYEPSNCRWATRREQNNNRCTNWIVEFRSESMALGKAYELSGCTTPYRSVMRRIKRGWGVDLALSEPKLGPEELRRRQRLAALAVNARRRAALNHCGF